MKDAMGSALKEGDRIAHMSRTSNNPSITIGHVLSMQDGLVTMSRESIDGRQPHPRYQKAPKNIEPWRCVKVFDQDAATEKIRRPW